MVPLVAAALAASRPSSATEAETFGRTAWIFATIGHSEFCPAGNVMVDLRSGRYSLTARAPRRICDRPDLERPVKRGRLVSAKLARLRAAYIRVLNEGLNDPECHKPKGRGPQVIIVDNGGTPTMVLTTGRATASAPDDLNCWTKAATALHDVLDEVFGVRNWHYI